jgi:hypothetical protein
VARSAQGILTKAQTRHNGTNLTTLEGVVTTPSEIVAIAPGGPLATRPEYV